MMTSRFKFIEFYLYNPQTPWDSALDMAVCGGTGSVAQISSLSISDSIPHPTGHTAHVSKLCPLLGPMGAHTHGRMGPGKRPTQALKTDKVSFG